LSRTRRTILVLVLGALVGLLTAGLPSVASAASGPTPITGPGQSAPKPTSPTPPSGLPTVDNGYDRGSAAGTAADRAAEDQAAASAKTTGNPVVVAGSTTETQQVLAQPKGGFELTEYPTPVRTQHGGSWVPVDLTLHRDATGRLAPGATAYGTVSFSSGGGSGPAVTTTSGATTYSLSWPTALPTPAVAGSTATYANVLPGVDLVLTANVEGGFSDVFVVHSASAAANPAVHSLRWNTTVTGGDVGANRTGGITVTPTHGSDALVAGPALMWDSSTSLATQPDGKTPHAQVQADPSDAGHPGMAARIAPITAKATATALTLTPDAGLLGNASAVYPEYVDPDFTWQSVGAQAPGFDEVKQGSPCNHVPLYNNTTPAPGDTSGNGNGGNLGVGYNDFKGWGCYGFERTYYEWVLPSKIWGAQIQSATVEASKTYSAACHPTAAQQNIPVALNWSGDLNDSTDWDNQPGPGPQITTQPLGPPAWGLDCQGNGAVGIGFDVTGPITQQAGANAQKFGASLTEPTEEANRDDIGFSRFSDNPGLQIYYDHKPDQPTNLWAQSGSDNAGCASDASPADYPIIGRTIQADAPVLNAVVSDPDNTLLYASFQYAIHGQPSTTVPLAPTTFSSGSVANFTLPWTDFVSKLQDGQQVDWSVQVGDGILASDWSPTCHFIAEPTPPLQPTIVSADGKYPNIHNGGTAVTPANTTGLFTVTTPSPSVSNYVIGLDQAPATSGPPASEVYPANGVGGSAATPAGHWLLGGPTTQGTHGVPTGTSAPDSAGSNPATLNPGANWYYDPARGGVLNLTGASNSYAQTSGPSISTTSSYSVSAWVNLSSTASYATAVGQDATSNSAFFLQYDAGDNRWSFAHTVGDGGTTPIHANSSAPPVLNTWTHLVGVYDSTSGSMTLYVNGAAQGTATDTAPFASIGPLSIGRSKYQGADADFFPGQISDVQLYQRVLTPAEIGTITYAATIPLTPDWPGPHQIYAYATDAAQDNSQTFAYPFLTQADPTGPASDPTGQYPALSAAFNDTAITAGATTGNIDGANSLPGSDLSAAGWQPGHQVTVDGGTFTLPSYGNGSPDNVAAANQTIASTDPALTAYNNTLPTGGTGAANTGTASLMFLATSTNTPAETPGAINGDVTAPYVPPGTPISSSYCAIATDPNGYCPAHGTIVFSDGTINTYDLTVPDWITGPASLAAITLPHEVQLGGTTTTAANPRIYAFSVPLQPGTADASITSVTLPDVGSQILGGVSSLHIFAMTVRNTTTGTPLPTGTTTTAPAGQSWAGTWTAPTEGAYNYENGSNYSNQTFRVALTAATGGSSVRITLDDALGTAPLGIGHVTIAPGSAPPATSPPSPTPAAAPTTMTVAGARSFTIPQGGMVYTDPLPFTVTAGEPLLVSFQLTAPIAYLPEHAWAEDGYQYVTAIGAGDQTTDTTGTPFTAASAKAGSIINVLTSVDVTTAGTGTQAVLGDNLTDTWQPNTSKTTINTAGDDLAAAQPSTPTPLSTVDAGIESNALTVDNPQTIGGNAVGGPAAMSRVDRDILDQPGLSSVVIDEGLQDLLGGQTVTAMQNAYASLMTYLASYHVAITVVGVTPCAGYGGGGNSPNDACTSQVDANRTHLNTDYLANNPLGIAAPQPPYFYLDPDTSIGVLDPSSNECKLAPAADTGDHVNVSQAGLAALTTVYLSPQDTWRLDDGSTDTSTTLALDTAASASSYWPVPVPTASDPTPVSPAGHDDLALAGTTWATDPARGGVLQLDGKTSVATSPSLLTTTGSFTIAAWVNLASTGHTATIASQDGTHNLAFALQYNATSNRWAFTMTTADTAGANTITAQSTTAPAINTWTHLVGSYNAATHALTLSVNGTPVGTASDTTPWNAAGSFALGRDLTNGTGTDFFPGELSTVNAFNYALIGPQVTALYQQPTPDTATSHACTS
jgi:hypothetical protein